ncbi:hypothetical protein GTZ93_39300 [Corallococcus exiguus]|uniref:DUF3592 domain-containing protein n=2 Tax=Corallococcus exiguus TaxID=83462 RepID=A0A7X5BTZ7_9BACT|nr:DUF3592 domain-containing protein [Corallococcus exiguus]NBC45856.1 hypothetical protein [Corallococcus exiguus]
MLDSFNLIMMVGLAFIVPLALLVQLLIQHELTLKLRDEGLHAYGTVTRAYRDSSGDSGTSDVVEYVFHLPDGEEIRGRYEDSRSSHRLPEKGDPVEVLYLANNPERHQCVGQEVGLAKTLGWLAFLVIWMGLWGINLMQEFQKQEASSPTRQHHKPASPSKSPPPRNPLARPTEDYN